MPRSFESAKDDSVTLTEQELRIDLYNATGTPYEAPCQRNPDSAAGDLWFSYTI